MARVPKLIQVVESCLVVSIDIWKVGGRVGGARRTVRVYIKFRQGLYQV